MLTDSQERIFLEGAKQISVSLSDEILSRFAIFIEELQRWSRIADLLSQTDTDTLICKHILDSLALLSWLPIGTRILDLGSGAGFPGLPLAIVNPDFRVTLIEARRKRANFLKESIRKLGLHNVKALEGRAEELAQEKELRGIFDIVATRATWNIALFLSLAEPFIRHGGVALAMKGPRLQEELTKMRESIEKAGFFHSDTKTYILPGGEKRNVAFFGRTHQ